MILTRPLTTGFFALENIAFHKNQNEGNMKQDNLFYNEQFPPRIRYQKLFRYLPEIPYSYCRGRPRTNPNIMLRCFVYRCLRRLATISDLAHSLAENPSLADAVGLGPFAAIPSVERFSAWLRSTPNECLRLVRFSLIHHLVQRGAVQGKVVALDSAPIPSPVRENNMKTSQADRFNKDRYPNTDPDARLGVYRVFPSPGPQRIQYFWGYRNHITVDFHTELPLWEETRQANIHESKVAVPMLQACSNKLNLSTKTVCADSAYDNEKILAYIIEDLKAQPIIAPNNRYQQNKQFRLQGKVILCPAELPMIFKGRMTPKKTGITYRQYCCPLHYGKRLPQKSLFCPANHPKFFSQKGCYFLQRVTPSYRSQIDYGSPQFGKHYKKRTSVERVFSRLLSIALQKPTVRGLLAIQNYCTIAHIAVLLVATAAYEQGHPDKLAFVRSFVPNFMVESPV